MRFQVPQFIETEEKIVGPFTIKQFFWVGGAATILFILFISFNLAVALIVGLPIAGIALLLGFLKIQDTLLSVYVFYAIRYLLNPKRYYFKQQDEANHGK